MQRLARVSVLCALALARPAFADTRAERLAVAQEYMNSAAKDIDIPAIIDTMSQPMLQKLAQEGHPASAAQTAAIKAAFMDTFTAPMQQALQDQVPIMADVFTLDEITALRDFYATPVGHSVILKLPKLLQAQLPQMQAVLQARTPELIPRITAIMAKP